MRQHRVRRRSAHSARSSRAAHVLIVVQNLPVPLDRRVWLECRALRGAGFDVSVICPKGGDDTAARETIEGVRVYRYRPAPPVTGTVGYVLEFVYAWLRTAWLSWRVWRRQPFHAMQACNPPDTYWALALLFRFVGVRFVYDQHDLCPEVYMSRFDTDSGMKVSMLRGLEWASYRVADHVISVNGSYRDVATGRGRVDPAEVTVVRSGPDPARMRKGDPHPAVRNGRDRLCCYLGVMGPQDGVELLVRAIGVYVHELGRTDCHFALLGFGDCLDDLRALTTELELDEWITFTGRADDTMIDRYLSTADLGLDPDPLNPLNDVSTMNKVLEYMAYELPVVAFELRESKVSADAAARFVEPNDVGEFAKAVAELLDNPDECRRMGEIGRRRIEDELGWPHQATRYVEVYRRLLGDPREAAVT